MGFEDLEAGRRKEPKALRRLRKKFTYEKRIGWFRVTKSREPHSDEELDAFAEAMLIECYNDGDEDIGDPPNGAELSED